MNWHQLSIAETLNKWTSSPSGLTAIEAKRRLHPYCVNFLSVGLIIASFSSRN
ncbi:MAG: cation-transporting P-type ATPase [Bacteroidota bacterium]